MILRHIYLGVFSVFPPTVTKPPGNDDKMKAKSPRNDDKMKAMSP